MNINSVFTQAFSQQYSTSIAASPDS